MAYTSFFAVIFLGLIFNYGCVSKDKDQEQKVLEDIQTDQTPTVTEPTPVPPITPPVTNMPLDPNAGKISLWKGESNYDSAVFLPADYGKYPNKLYPMILSLHGLNGSVLNTAHTAVGGGKTGFIKQVWGTALSTSFPAIVIAPNWSPAGSTASGLWNHSQLRKIILAALLKYKIEPTRVVATGLSAGSIATQELIKYSKDLLAGAMPGAYNNNLFLSAPCQVADLPVWVFGNTSDSYFQYAGWNAMEPKVQACANYTHDFTLTVYQSSCGHGCWDAHWAKPEVQAWLINQSQ